MQNASSALLTESDLAKHLNISLAALRRWRTEKRGPIYRKLGSLVRYHPDDIARWLQSCSIDAGAESQHNSAGANGPEARSHG